MMVLAKRSSSSEKHIKTLGCAIQKTGVITMSSSLCPITLFMQRHTWLHNTALTQGEGVTPVGAKNSPVLAQDDGEGAVVTP